MLGQLAPGGSVELAIFEYAEGVGGPPNTLIEAYLCDVLKCWPEDLDGHDVMRLLRNQAALAFYRAAQKPMEQWTAEDRELLEDLRNRQWERKWRHE